MLIVMTSCTSQKISRPEKWWAATHPFIARKTFLISKEASKTASEMEKEKILDGDGNGGRIDAFRHAYWMALLSQKIKIKKALKLGMAHEKGNYLQFKKHQLEEGTLPDSMSSVMDLWNNKVGAELGYLNRELNKNDLKEKIMKAITIGEMCILKKDSMGNYLQCNLEVIDLNQYRQWNIPKCLIGSEMK